MREEDLLLARFGAVLRGALTSFLTCIRILGHAVGNQGRSEELLQSCPSAMISLPQPAMYGVLVYQYP